LRNSDKAKIAAEDAQRAYAATLQAKANIDESRGESNSVADAEEKTLLYNNAMDSIKKASDRTISASMRSKAAATQADGMFAAKISEVHGLAAQQASNAVR
jgi:hypothetical protein